ncbi:MAG: hypothetical protein A3K66_01635 [Euryarchaeota archaeon RBG_16_67_27]|nr:MAG: hypothetical protein A3K66_01635 [Euryarchaeota archaeon RBG_16_67_27]
MDASPKPELVEGLRRTVLQSSGVSDVHSLRARSSGNRVLVDLCVHVPAELPLNQAHALAHSVEERLRAAFPEVSEAIVHVEPWDHTEALDEAHPRH